MKVHFSLIFSTNTNLPFNFGLPPISFAHFEEPRDAFQVVVGLLRTQAYQDQGHSNSCRVVLIVKGKNLSSLFCKRLFNGQSRLQDFLAESCENCRTEKNP